MKKLYFLIAILIVFASGIILLAISEMPPYGQADNPIHNEVTDRYINKSLEETGTDNMVTSIVLDYRGYDTMFETTVLFTATLAVLITLKLGKKEDEE